MADSMTVVKYVKLKRSETCGFGFSILGGAGSELPPIVYDIIEGSPAANSCQLAPGDVIWEVNGQEVISLTTKEVLNCLRLSTNEVTLKLKTDAGIQQRVQQYLATPNNPDVLRTAITRDDLQGVKQIKAKKSASRTPPEQSSSTPPSLPSPTLSDASDRASISHGSNHTASENGIHIRDRTSAENERNTQKKPKSEAYLMTGDLILNLSRTSHDPSWLPQQKTVDDLRKSGSSSVPTSPNENVFHTNRLAKHEVGSPQSLCSPVSADNNTGGVQFTYPPTSTAVRISKSEDHLQYQKDNMCAVNIELDDDVTSSLNTLLDTRDDSRTSPEPEDRDHRIVWTFNAPTSPDSVHSSHDSDSPLIRSPSPASPLSPTSSMQYSCSGVYDKMCSGRDSLGSSNRSENVLSNSSSLTSPDTDVPDELEWDDTTPTLHIPSSHANGFSAKDLLPNGHNNMGSVMTTDRGLVPDRAKVRKQDENRIVIKVEGPDKNSKRKRPQQLSKSGEQLHQESPDVNDVSRDPDLTPTNTRPPTPGSGTLSPDTLAYQELRESEDEITCLSEEDGVGKASIRTSSTTSPPLSEDESDIDSLHSFHYSPKAVDIPSAVRLAKRLVTLDGFKKSDVSRHLSKNNEFSRAVADEYLNYFDFRSDTLDVALRKFLDKFCLAGETQERERVLVHFSRRFLDCNPGTFNSQDAVHTLTCALMLLNTDLHGQSVGRKMTCNEFIDNLADLNDGENFPREVLKSLYHAIRNKPLQWAMDEDGDNDASGTGKGGSGLLDSQAVVGSNPFLAPPSGNGIQYKKGYIMRKCCTDPNGKKTAFGKRSWKMWFCVIQDLVLYLHKDEQGARRGPQHAQLGHNAIRLHHALATRAHDYSKKEHVFRLQTADQAEYLLQTSDSKELQAWIDTINLVAASLSAAPLPGAVGSQRKFQRPLLPCSITKLTLTEQLEDHTERLAQLERELEDHKAHPPEKNSKIASASNYREKESYLTSEIKRYRTYVYLLRSRLTTQQGGQQGTSSGIDVGDLPVFEARPVSDGSDGGDRGSRVIPPPIPERARPGDSPPPDDFRNEIEDFGTIRSKMELIDVDNLENFAKFSKEEDDKSNQGTLKKKNKEDKDKRKLEKENEKFFKEMEKREKSIEKREKAREKKEQEEEKKIKEKERRELEKQEKRERERQSKEQKKSTEKKENSDDSHDYDPRIGTLDRISALFRFSKLNNKGDKEQDAEDDDDAKGNQTLYENVDPEAPPLPPKPAPNSPIMRNVGTRLDI
ncbi:PH and SEC7 domain-containing protein-like isoform X1 [Palaemon carinicauda]|uniref:PH and SEC7 domain-containing protein-like isoform X1 n=1 Tax=Palaemon carinicauda TaxID=392227 RepID=UPI0035B5CEE5